MSTKIKTRKPSFRLRDQRLAETIERICHRSLDTRKGSLPPVRAKPILVVDNLLKHYLQVGITCPPANVDATPEAIADYIEDWAVNLLLAADIVRERRSF